MNTMIQDRIADLRRQMKKHNIDIYIVPTADYHQSEYVGEYFKCREFLTGFTGSAGTAVITQMEALLWTDGRYFIQAETQLKGTGILLKKSGEAGVPTIFEYVEKKAGDISASDGKTVIGFDGRSISIADGKRYAQIAEKTGGAVCWQTDLTDEIWEDRPALPCKPAFLLETKYTGESVSSKLLRLRQKMKERKADLFILTGLDDIGWLLNLRGGDVAYCPLVLSYAVVRAESVELYTDSRKLNDKIMESFRENQVTVYPYRSIYERVKGLSREDTVLFDPEQMNYALYRNLPKQMKRVEAENPILLMKAVKNETELSNIRTAHLKDGVACTKFMYWLKTRVGKERISEVSAAEKLAEFRARQMHFLGESFEPICAYKEHGAIVHYSATTESDMELKPQGLLLCDTGGHYLEGSTDITRTFALGALTQDEKDHFTTVLISMLRLADARFLYGCNGMSLDYAAREPFWRQNLNFNHGTGHGVGYLGNIHEPPARFFWKMPAGSKNAEEILRGVPVLEAGMVITDEPGIYIENSHGVRIENELLVAKGEANEYGQFMHFETLTFVPVDLDAVNTKLMTEYERGLLNRYHRAVREKLSPYLTEEEKEWLLQYTREI